MIFIFLSSMNSVQLALQQLKRFVKVGSQYVILLEMYWNFHLDYLELELLIVSRRHEAATPNSAQPKTGLQNSTSRELPTPNNFFCSSSNFEETACRRSNHRLLEELDRESGCIRGGRSKKIKKTSLFEDTDAKDYRWRCRYTTLWSRHFYS